MKSHPTPGARRAWRRRGLAAISALALLAALLLAGNGAASAAAPPTRAFNVNLAKSTGPAKGVGQGVLYGINQDASLPADQYLQPLQLNAFRGGGWFSGGWIADNYTFGPKTQAEIATIIAQAKRLESSPNHVTQYQVLLSDLFGSTGGAGPNTHWPCANGDCSNWITFIDDALNALKGAGVTFAFDIFNEPDLSIFWGPGVNTTQYFQMWDSAYKEIRRLAPGAVIAGPSFAFTPLRNPAEWQTWFAHVTAAGTVPDIISNHDEGDVDDPVAVGNAIEADAAAAGLPHLPLSANEYQPADRQTAGVTAWYLDRFQGSNYVNAMRGNWQCCMIPNLTGLLTHTASGWAPNGNWWAMRTAADLTGSLVSVSDQVGSTAIAAAKDPANGRAVALLGDSDGYTGAASVTFTGLSSVPWLEQPGRRVHVTVYRIPDQAPLYARPVVYDQTVSAAGGSITVPVTFQSAHDAFGIYLSWTDPNTVSVQAPDTLTAAGTYQVPVTYTNGSGVVEALASTSLSVSSDNPADAAALTVTCKTGGKTCPPTLLVAPGRSTTSVFTVTVPPTANLVAYRFTGTTMALALPGGKVTASNSVDITIPCALGRVCEAENGALTGGACLATDHPGYTGSGFVACLTSPGGSVAQQFSVPTAGTYTLDLRYAAGPNGPQSTRTASVIVNGGSPQQIALPLTGSWNTWGDATISLALPAGKSTIAVSYLPTDLGWFNLDSFTLTS